VDGQLVHDPTATLPGRGAWLHPNTDCLILARERRAFERALRTKFRRDNGIDFEEIPWQKSA
jgi:predicted RNA-binding protein YlxR (DUF448 family)